MNNKKWKQFDALTEQCEEDMAGMNPNKSCWKNAYLTLKDIVKQGRRQNPDFPKKLYELDDITDFEHDIQSFLEDYFDTMEEYGKYEIILRTVDELLELFEWDKSNIADIYFPKSTALSLLNRQKEAVEFCQKWLNDYPDNIFAITALIHAMIKWYNSDNSVSLDSTKELVKKYIHPDTECTDENDILFIAASLLAETIGNEKMQKSIDSRLNAYEARLEDLFMYEDDQLPF